MKAEEVKRGVGTRLSSLSRGSAPTATTQTLADKEVILILLAGKPQIVGKACCETS
nr:MAG TPA: hypothetical protein [Caudoviricetes sp.]